MTDAGLQLRDAVVVLAAAGLVVPLMHRLSVSPVLGFLLVGILLGPDGPASLAEAGSVLSWLSISDPQLIRIAGEFGVMFLLFMIGLELSLDRLWRMRRWVFGLGSAQVLVTATIIGAIASAFGNPVPIAAVLGLCLALSSTAVVMQMLVETGRLGTPPGQMSFSVLLMQDLAVVPILFLTAVLAGGGSQSVTVDLVLALGKAALAVVVILLVGRLVVRPVLRLVAATRSRELFLAVVLLVAIGTAAITQAAGLSLALGAFLAGLLLAETEFRHRIAVDLEPFKGLLLGIFFLSVGFGINLREIIAEPVLVPASAVGLIVLKAAILYGLARLFGATRASAAEAALLLGQGGEFAFIVINLALAAGLMPREVGQFMLLVVGLSMAATPLLAVLARRVGEGLSDGKPGVLPPDAGDIAGHVVIVGYGRVGRTVGRLLDSQAIAHIAIETRVERVAELSRAGIAVYQGDGAQHAILEHLGMNRAAGLVVTMDDPVATRRVVDAAHRDWPDVPIYARARDEEHARDLIAAGARHVTLEATEASLQLGEAVLVGSGVPDEAARGIIAEARGQIAI